jgi:hypothetical protein
MSNEGIFFRGQRKLYTLDRDHMVREALFADSCAIEPSLITAASRNINDGYIYDEIHFKLRRFIEQHLYSQDKKLVARYLEKWREECESPICKLDYAVMALAQHYGLPTHGLDVTTSIDVATWFATNLYNYGKPGEISSYKKMNKDEWPENPADWPIVLVCQMVTNSIGQSLQDCQELSHFGLEAKRPMRQNARFFHGGHSDHQNRLAEAVVCIFRLRPGQYETECSFDSLFPAPDKDPAYKLMLEFSDKYKNSCGDFINRLHK